MELYGSLLNISGSVTASAFTGSFIGDGSGLTGIQASGVTGLNLSQISNGNATASISPSGFIVNKNTQIQGNLSVTGALIATEYIVSSSVTYMTTSFASGSSAFGNDNNDVHQFTGSVQITGSISLNGQAIGTGKLDETTFQSYTSSNNSRVSALETSSGSLNSFTSSINTTIKSKLDGDNVISGSIQVALTGTTGYSTFSSSVSTSIADVSSSIATTTSNLSSSIGSVSSSVATTTSDLSSSIGSLSSSVATTTSNLSSSIGSVSSSIATTTSNLSSSIGSLSSSIATTDLNQSNRLDSIEGKTGSYATTGSNLFKGTQTLSGSILPSVDNTYDLGSPDYQWRDVYISSGSLYIDGTKVLSSTTQELTITTDNGQSIKILESGTDSIILQTADGDIELKSNADGDILLDPTNGKILLKGTVEVLNGNKIQSSVGGTPVVFASDIVVSGSIDITGTIEGINLTDFSSSVNTRLGSLESSSGSLNSFTSSANSKLNSLESTTSSLNSYTSSNNTRLSNIEETTGSLNSYTSSNTTNINAIHTATSSLNSYTSSNTTNINAIHAATSSLNSYTSSNNTRLGNIEISTGSINTFTSSANSRLSSIETTTGSIIGVNTTQNNRLDSLETTSGSILTTNTAQNGRLDSIEGKTGSYATTGSNIFIGNQTITGSLYVSQDLIIAGSSSIQHISSSVVNIADNIITVNAQNPSIRFGGLAVIDSGSSPQVSGSMLFDSTNDQWIFVHQNQSSVTSSILLMGPQTFNNLGSEAYPTTNRILKSVNAEHVGDSNISDNGTTVTILSNTVVNGTFSATGTTIVSGSSQISHDSTTGYVANRHIDHTSVSISAGNGLSGGGDISATRTVTLDTGSVHFLDGVKKELNTEGVISGSAQVVAALPSGTVSGSSQVLFGTGIWSGSAQLPSGVVSGSSQVLNGTTIHSGAFFNGISVVSGSSQISFNGITDKPTLVSGSSQITYGSLSGIPSGIVSGSSQITFGSISSIPGGLVSGSSQIDLTATTNYSTGIKTRLNAEGVLSGSSQVSYGSISGIPSGIVSGSSQITYGSISGIPSGIVSGSSQITYGSISGIPSGIVSGSSQISFGSVSGIPSGLVSGSSQISFGSISSIPSGLVSGSSQITLSSTTGYGSVLNQAVLTTSTPTFAGLTLNGILNVSGGSSGGFTNGTINWVSGTGGGLKIDSPGTNLNLGTGWNERLILNAGTALDINTNNGSGTYTTRFTIDRNGNINTTGALTTTGQVTAGYSVSTEPFVQGHFHNTNTTSNQAYGGVLVSGINQAHIRFQVGTNTWGGVGAKQWQIRVGNGSGADDMRIYSWTLGADALTISSNATLTIGKNTGTMISHGSMSDAFGYNASYGTYIGSPVGGTYYIYANGQMNNNGSIVTLLHSSNFTSYAMSGAGYSANQNLNTNNTVQFGSLGVGVSPALTLHARGAGEMVRFENTSAGTNEYTQLNFRAGTRNGYIWLGNQSSTAWAGDGGLNIYTDYGNMDFWTNGTQKTRITRASGALLHGDVTAAPDTNAWLGTAVFGVSGYNKVIIGSLNSSTTGAYVGGHNSALTAWANLNIAGEAIIFRYQQTERARFDTSGNFIPGANNAYNLGSASLGWANVYTNDLHLSNMNKPEGNDVDGTNGNWTIQEGAENLYIINNNNGKKFKISLEEII